MIQHKDSKEPKIRQMIRNGILSDSDIALCCGVTWKHVKDVKLKMKQEASGSRSNVG